MTDYREEIKQAQQNRADLLKWKLVITASLGAAGTGIGFNENSSYLIFRELIFCLIPFIFGNILHYCCGICSTGIQFDC